MAHFDTRSVIEAAAAAAPRAAARPLAAAAEHAAAEPVMSAMSPIVVAGAVRMIELALIALIGTIIYAGYVVPQDGIEWRYFGAVAGISLLAMLAFQTAD